MTSNKWLDFGGDPDNEDNDAGIVICNINF